MNEESLKVKRQRWVLPLRLTHRFYGLSQTYSGFEPRVQGANN
jgi:hypothetical protein